MFVKLFCLPFLAVVSVVFNLGFQTPAHACGTDSDCVVAGDRSYRVYAPEALTPGELPRALIFAHGFRSSSTDTMRNRRLRGLVDDLGVVLIALNASGNDWSLPNAPQQSFDPDIDEMAYIDAVMADASRFGVTPERTIVAGFSAGGMMTWNVACARGDAFAGYLPISGVFWSPIPEACTAPAASLIHLHGINDRIVPLDGRAVGGALQGNVAASIEMYAAHGGFVSQGTTRYDNLTCTENTNADGRRLDLCLSNGEHGFRISDLEVALGRLSAGGW